MKRYFLIALALPIWGVSLLFWTFYVNGYAAQAAVVRDGASHWPAASQLTRHPEHPTLVMFLHPQCFCSRASLWELEELLSQHPQRISTILVMVSDAEHEIEWRETALQKHAAQLQDVTVIQDCGSLEASRFRAGTSGETYLYSSNGILLFQGGITAARGHMGDAPGQQAIHELVDRHREATMPNEPSRCSVFGCRLTQRVESIP